MCAAAIKEMLPYMMETYGNPSSLHSEGQKAAMALQDARERIADPLAGLPPYEVRRGVQRQW